MPSQVKIIDPSLAECDQVGNVVMVYYDGPSLVVVDIDGKTKTYRENQVEVLHVHDWDNWLRVTGSITIDTWNKLSLEFCKYPELFLSGGWMGEQGVMNVKCELYQASENLDKVRNIVSKYGLSVIKPIRTLF